MAEKSDARKRATQKYKAANYKKFSVEMSLDEYSKLTEHVKATSQSQNGFIRKAIQEKIERESAAFWFQQDKN